MKGAVVYVVNLLGKDRATALAYPSMAKQLFDERKEEGERGAGS